MKNAKNSIHNCGQKEDRFAPGREKSTLPTRHACLSILVTALALLSSGCMSVKSYVDKESLQPRQQSTELRASSNPGPVYVKVAFQTNGKPNARGTKDTAQKVLWTLQNSKLFSSIETTPAENTASLDILLNNVADVGAAVGKGIGTGFTFGAVGSGVTDGYLFTGTYQRPGQPPVVKEYRHAIYSTVGAKAGPTNLQAMSPQEAFYTIVEQLLHNFLADLQQNGIL